MRYIALAAIAALSVSPMVALADEPAMRVDAGVTTFGGYVGGSYCFTKRLSFDACYLGGSFIFSSGEGFGVGFSYYGKDRTPEKGKWLPFCGIRGYNLNLKEDWLSLFGASATKTRRWYGPFPIIGAIYHTSERLGVGIHALPLPTLTVSYSF